MSLSVLFDAPNPLLIDVILNEIWPKLEIKELLSSQLVCQKWYALTTPFIRKHGPRIEFQTAKILKKILPRINRICGQGLLDVGNGRQALCGKLILHVDDDCTEYQKLMNVCTPAVTYLEIAGEESILCNNTILRNWILGNPELITLKLDSEVLQKSGKLFNPKGKEDGSVKLKALREFSLMKVSNEVRLNPDFFDELFRKSQNLKRLSIDLEVYYDDAFDFDDAPDPDPQIVANQNVDVVLKSLEDQGNLDRLQSMKFTRMANSHLTTLLRCSEKGLNLKCFELMVNWTAYGFDDELFDERKLHQFLTSQRTTLTKLVISAKEIRHMFYEIMGSTFDVLENLEMVVKKGTSFGRARLAPGVRPPPPSFRFHEMFPNLTSLVLKGSGISGLIYEFFEDTHIVIPCTTLKHLRLPPGKFTSEEDIAEKFSQLFPNITSLDVRLPTNEFLHGIWKFWPELTDLKVVCVNKPRAIQKPKFGFQKPKFGNHLPRFGYKKPILGNRARQFPFGFKIPGWGNDNPKRGDRRYCDYLDYGFTGIDRKICSQIEENGWNSESFTSSIIQEFKIKPSITDLKKLKRLNLQFVSILKPGITRQAKIVSDIFVYAALIKIPQLEELVVSEKLLNFERILDKPTSDFSLKAIEDLKKTLLATKIQVTSKSAGKNWEESYRTKNFSQIGIYDIADSDVENAYTILQASAICKNSPKST